MNRHPIHSSGRWQSRNDYPASPAPVFETAKPCAPADRFEHGGSFYDRSLLVKLRGTFPIIYASKEASVGAIVVDDKVTRYEPASQTGTRTTPDLVFVDHNMKPILVPANYDGKPLKQVYLVTKHSFKKALVST